MKKLVASVLTLVMLFSCIPGFAAVTPMSGDDTIAKTMYSCNTLTVGGNVDSAKFVGGLTAGDPAPTQTANNDGTATITHKKSEEGNAQKTETYLWFGYNKSEWIDENMSFGFDIKFDDVTVNDTSKIVMSTNIGANTAQIPDHGTSKTAWHFYKQGSADMTCYLNVDNKIQMGNAVMEQGKTYTVKVWLNAVKIDAKTFVVTVTDTDGNTQVAVADGAVQNVFQGFGKVNFTINNNTNENAKVTVGKTFVNSDDPYGLGLVADENLAVSDDGTVDVAIRVPSGYTDAKLYVHDALAEDITQTNGVTDYTANIQLPEAVTTGEATLKLEAKNGDNTETVTRSVILTREYVVEKKSWPISGTAPFGFGDFDGKDGTDSQKEVEVTANSDAQASGGFALKFTDNGAQGTVSNFEEYSGGVYEYEYQFQTGDDPTKTSLRGRFTYDTSQGTGIDINGESNYHYVTKASGDNATPGKIGTATLEANTWYTLKVRVDLSKEDSGTWSYILNDKVVKSGTISNYADTKDESGNITTSGKRSFKGLRFHFAGITLRNLKMNQIIAAVPTVTKVVADYTDGSIADATSTTVSSVNLNKLTFTTSEAITLGTKGAKILDANGNAISATVTASGKEITATYSGDTLTDGTYKLVICGDATFGGSKLGVAVTKDFTLTADSIILSPANNSTVSDDTVAISVYAKDAGTMRICVDDVKICDDFTVIAGATVNKNYTPTANGSKQVQVYLFSGDNVTVLNSAFTVANTSRGNGFTVNDIINQSGEASIVWKTDNPLAGRACFEGDITPYQTDKKIRVEIGSATTGENSTDTDNGKYITLYDALGYCEKRDGAEEALFNDNGKLYNTEIAYEANKTYHIKYVIDYENDTYEFYVDGKLIATKKSTEETDSLKEATNWHAKFRFQNGNSKAGYGTADYKNFVAYEEYTVPQIASINDSTLSDGYYPVYGGDASIEIALDKAYAELTKNNVTLKADGEALDMTDVTVINDPNDICITLEGCENLVKKGQILTVTIDKNATVSVPDKGTSPTELAYKTVAAGTALEVNLIVLDADNDDDFVVLPLQKVVANGKGYAYCRWINSGSEVNAKLILADYENADATAKRLEKASVKDVTLGGTAGQIGVITGSIDGSVDRAFLWTTDSLTPLTTD